MVGLACAIVNHNPRPAGFKGGPKLSLLSLFGPFACVYEVKAKSKVDTQVVTEGLSVDTQVVTLIGFGLQNEPRTR
jgi:hypothetical protein